MSTDVEGTALADTGFFVAIRNRVDVNHEPSVELFETLKERGINLLTSDYVLDEAVTLAFRRTRKKDDALAIAEMILNSKYVRVVYSDETLVAEAVGCYRKYLDKELSFTDCLLMVLAQNLSVKYLVTFDGEFSKVANGFCPVSSREDLL